MSALDISVSRSSVRLRFWRWQFWFDRKWQESSAVSACFWVLNSYLIFSLVEQFGHGVLFNALVSLGWDGLTFAVNKLWIWRRSRVSLRLCYSRNFGIWLAFFVANASLFWLLHSPGNVGVHHTRYILGAIGILVNPVRFRINKNRIFRERIETV